MSKQDGTGSLAQGLLSGFTKLFSELFTKGSDYEGWGPASRYFDQAIQTMGNIVKPFSKVQSAASDLARSLGLAGSNIMNVAQRAVATNKRMQLSTRYDISNEERFALEKNVLTKLGRNVAINETDTVIKNERGEVVNPNFSSELEYLIAGSKIFGNDTMADMVAGFDKVGKSMLTASRMTGKLFKEAGTYGINLQKYTQNFTQNLGMVQTYNFRNGINGLREMARKATEIRQDMQQVASFAEKVGTVTGAVETAANLQVLGGSFAALANPLTLLNQSMTDMEGLQKTMAKMTEGTARYNSITHEIEMDPVTRQIMKRAAESMGVDANNLIDQAYAQERRRVITEQMRGFSTINEDFAKMIGNVGQIDDKTGMAGVNIGGDFYSLAQISGMDAAKQKDLQEQLVKEQRSESEDIKAIYDSVRVIEEGVSGRHKQIENEMAYNKIIPGVIGGTSTWNAVADTLVNHINQKAMSGVAALDNPFQSLIDGARSSIVTALGDFNSAFDSSSLEEFKKTLKEGLKSNIGDGPVANVLTGAISGVMGAIGKLAVSMNDNVGGEVGFDIFVRQHTEKEQAIAKGTTTTAVQATTAGTNENVDTEYEAAWRAITGHQNSTNFSGNRTEEPVRQTDLRTQTLQKVDDREIQAAARILTGSSLVENQYKVNVNHYNEAQKQGNIIIEVDKNSIPSSQVAPTNTQTQTTTTTSQPGIQGQTLNYNLNITGTIKMDITGDKGKIGQAEILKMLESEKGFRDAIAKAIADAVAQMDAGGVNHNQ